MEYLERERLPNDGLQRRGIAAPWADLRSARTKTDIGLRTRAAKLTST
jgi:hypothetical protein